MSPLDKERHLREILQGFQKIDEIYFEFEKEFLQILKGTIDEYYFDFLIKNDVENEFKHFANLIFNTAESVIDKDKSYPDYRLIEELKNVKRISNIEFSIEIESSEFSEKLSKRLKQLTIKYFNGIYQLSGNGFRLLEINIKHNIFVFLDWFSLQVNE